MNFKVPTPSKAAVDPAKLAAFAAGVPAAGQTEQGRAHADNPPPVKPSFEGLDNTRRRPAFSMRFTDLETAQLKHIADTTPHSAHAFCLAAVQKAIAEHFAEAK